MKEAPYAFGSRYEVELAAPDERWKRTVTDRTRFIADLDGVVAGTVSGGESEMNGAAAVTGMWVDPSYRRRGVGDVLVKHVLQWARGAGYAYVFLWVTAGNSDAERLYERNGFRRTGAEQEVRPGQLEYEMSREL